MSEVILHGAKPTEDERSILRAHVGRMHCVPLAAVYAAYVATCLVRGEVVEDMETFEARLRQYFVLDSDRGGWAGRPVILEGIVYGVWFNDETRRFVVDPTTAVTSRIAARSDVNPSTSVDAMVTEPTRGRPRIRRRQRDVSTRTISHTSQTANSDHPERTALERTNA